MEWEHLNEEPKAECQEGIGKDLEVGAISHGGKLIHIKSEITKAGAAATVEIHGNDPHEHEYRTDEQIQHKLHSGVILTNRTPNPNEGVHWYESQFEENVEEQEVL